MQWGMARLPLRLDLKIGHSTKGPIWITDQPNKSIFFLPGTKIYHWADKNKAFSKFRVNSRGQILTNQPENDFLLVIINQKKNFH